MAACSSSLPTTALSEKEFASPSIHYRGKTFWSWNGRLQREELLRQIDVIKEMGMGGAFMHSRTGLQTTYLGDEWFSLINDCSAKMEQMGLEGWIYDEDRWPSGSAGGLATQEKTHRMQSMVVDFFQKVEQLDLNNPDLLGVFAVRVEGEDLLDYRPLGREGDVVLEAGEQVLTFTRNIHPDNSFYNGGSYLDTLSREATDHFMSLTHEKYKEKSGQFFGKGIHGIFTDEPHRGFIFCKGVEQPGAEKPEYALPYTGKLFAEFEARFGYRLQDRLPELCYRFEGESLSPLKADFCELLQQLFLENWAQPAEEWCDANGMRLTGHVLHEDSVAAQAVPCGSLLRYYEHMHAPGIDVLGAKTETFWAAKQVVSTARQFGKEQVLSEMYGGTGWDMNFMDHKRIGDWQAFLGVNLRCHHLSWYNMEGEAKRDYPASIFHQSAWYKEYAYIEDYFSRIHYLLSEGRPDCDVLVLHPIESFLASFRLGWAVWLSAGNQEMKDLDAHFSAVCMSLLDGQIDFDYGDEEQISRLAKIEKVDGEAVLHLGKMSYRTVVVSGLLTMRSSVLEILEDFANVGGKVIFAGDAPSHLDARRSPAIIDFAERAGVQCTLEDLPMQARQGSRQHVLINDGRGQENLIAHTRLLENGDVVIAMVNRSENELSDICVRLPELGSVQKLDCRTGESSQVAAAIKNDGLEWSFTLTPYEEAVFVASAQVDKEDGKPVISGVTEPIEFADSFPYEIAEPNVRVLDKPAYKIGDGEWQAPEDILRIDIALRDQMGWKHRKGTMVQPWFNQDTAPEQTALHLRYEFSISEIPSAMHLVIEQPEQWQLFLNGEPIKLQADGWYIDIALHKFALDMDQLQEGLNTLECRCTKMRDDIGLEALYLIGDFGVYASEENTWTIGALPESLRFGSIVSQGFPHYTGELNCLLSAKQELLGEVTCRMTTCKAATNRIRLGGETKELSFTPFSASFQVKEPTHLVEVKLVFTRYNLFGPLRRLPLDAEVTSPDSFHTKGEEYSEEYVLADNGLLAAPEVFVH